MHPRICLWPLPLPDGCQRCSQHASLTAYLQQTYCLTLLCTSQQLCPAAAHRRRCCCHGTNLCVPLRQLAGCLHRFPVRIAAGGPVAAVESADSLVTHAYRVSLTYKLAPCGEYPVPHSRRLQALLKHRHRLEVDLQAASLQGLLQSQQEARACASGTSWVVGACWLAWTTTRRL